MSTTTQYKTAADILLRVRFATHQIEAARKQSISVFDEDLRLLRDLDSRLATSQTINEPELFEPTTIMSPDVQELLAAPLAKYAQ